jgi:cytochrome c oxidase assembly protein subunit 15
MIMNQTYSRIAFLATLLALCVVMLGAYTRLSDAGLGCPDWPGCYGHLTVPSTPLEIQQAEHAFKGQTVEAPKAWKEMVHRYFAGTLGVLIVILAVWGILRKRFYRQQPVVLPIFLVLLVLFQAVLGMWTVTWKVLPIVVSAHLLGGLAIVALLWYLRLATRPKLSFDRMHALYLKPWAIVGLVILVLQIFLGAWTSTTYSALACHDFPYCHGSLFPPLNLAQAFQLFQPIGINYEGGVLETPIRITIQMMHRYGAFVTAIYLGILAIWIIFANKTTGLRGIAGVLLLLLLLQVLLGIANVMLGLPLSTAVAHNGVAALLLMALVTLIHKLKRRAELRF